MAERPDLDYAIPKLAEALVGLRIEETAVIEPVVLRLMAPGPLAQLLVGRTVGEVHRRAQFAQLVLDEGWSVLIAPMLAGRFALAQWGRKRRKDVAVALRLGDELELQYRDDARMGKVYVCRTEDWRSIPGLEAIGLDALDPSVFTLEAFRDRIRPQRQQVRLFLMDKSQVDSLGNAYADEVLFEAGVHAKVRCNKLTEAQIEALHAAVPKVLGEALATLQARQPALEVKLRDFVKVRNRKGQPCPRCGTPIRVAGVRGFDSFFCPSCQKAPGGGLVDWSRLPR